MVFLVAMPSCTGANYKVSDSTDGYRAVEFENEVCRYFVELPAGYEPVGDNISTTDDFYFSELIIWGPPHYMMGEVDGVFNLAAKDSVEMIKYWPVTMNIRVYRPLNPPYSPFGAKDEAERQIEWLKNNYKEISDILYYVDQAPKTVAGIEGLQITYQVNRTFPTGADDRGQAKYSITRDVYFDHGGLVWKITLQTDDLSFEENIIEFEHVLGSFKVIN